MRTGRTFVLELLVVRKYGDSQGAISDLSTMSIYGARAGS